MNRSDQAIVALLALTMPTLTACQGGPAPVSVRETTWSLPWHTRELRADGSAAKGAREQYNGERAFHIVRLEIEYLRVDVLPEVGGAVGRVIYKPTGDDLFFYEGSDGVLVWLRTLRPAKVEVVVMADDGEKRFGPVASEAASDLTAVVPVTGLAPNKSYVYRVLVDGKAIKMPESAQITTAPTEKQQTRLAFSSCAHTGGFNNAPLLAKMRARQVHALLTNGDTISHDSGRHRGKQRAGYLTRDGFPAWRELSASVPAFATWDDHDYFGNDLGGIPSGFTKDDQLRTWEVFRHNSANPSYGFGDERRGVFLRTRIGPADVIMTDNRYFRDPFTKAGVLGPDQMKWVEQQLLDCKGPFVILCCGTMWSDYVSAGKDSWGKHDRAGRERLFRFIEEHRIAGVLLISGDRHGASGWKIPRPSGFTFYEFEVANLGPSGDHSKAAEKCPDAVLFCTGRDPVSKANHFGQFTFDPTPSDPTVTFNLVSADGKSEYELVLKRSQLTPQAASSTSPAAMPLNEKDHLRLTKAQRSADRGSTRAPWG